MKKLIFLLVPTFLFHSSLYAAQFTEEDELDLFSKATPEQTCKYRVLKQLGWIAEKGPTEAKNDGGNPCEVNTVQEAYAQGHLRLIFPENLKQINPQVTFSDLEKKLQSDASLCAYKLGIAGAASAAEEKLKRNYNYTFSGDDKFLDVPEDRWAPLVAATPYTCAIAKESPSQAIQCFYDRECRTECAAGRQLMEYAVLHELYGQRNFDLAFSPNEVAIGTWHRVRNSDNVFYGKPNSSGYSYPSLTPKIELGAHILVGLAGAVANVKGESFLDSPNNRNENFVIISATQESAKNLIALGGLDAVDKLSEEVWQLGNSMADYDRDGMYRDYAAGLSLSHYSARIDEILSNPFYKGIQVYVHPLNTMNFGTHILRQLKINPRTNYRIQIQNGALNSKLFERYTNFHYDRCLKEVRLSTQVQQTLDNIKPKSFWKRLWRS